jgi:hypothetical protein
MASRVVAEAAGKDGASYAFTWPRQFSPDLNSSCSVLNLDKSFDERYAIRMSNNARAIIFWRHMGFRRVGTSNWFCSAMDITHPVRHLNAKDDFEPQR